MINATLEGKIGKNAVYYCNAPFNDALSAVYKEGAKLISPEQLARSRIKSDKGGSFWQNGSCVNVGVVYANNQIILVKNGGPVVENAKAATEAHRKGIEYLIADDVANKYVSLAQKGDKSVFVVKDRKNISTDTFAKSDLAVWLFGSKELTKTYGQSLKNKGVKEMPLYFDSEEHIKSQKGPYANQLWLGSLANYSLLNGYSGALPNYSRVRGVRSLVTAGGSRAEKLPYKKNQLNSAYRITQNVLEGKEGNSKLKKVLAFFEQLKLRKN